MIEAVVDASAVLAVLHGEPGAERFETEIDVAIISAVNMAEVVSRLVLDGMDAGSALTQARRVLHEVSAFDLEQAAVSGALIQETRPFGLSLGDRACLALGKVRGLPVYTADRAWLRLDLGVAIHMIR